MPGLFTVGLSELLEAFLGDYDLVSWDPRGVGSTLPALSCFPDEPTRLATFGSGRGLYVSQSNDSIIQLDAIQRSIAKQCERYAGRVKPYVGSMYVAQDLRRLVEAYGYSDKIQYL